MSELVTELRVIGTDSNIFDTDMNYVIPLYQRAYAWEDKQLIQLVEDTGKEIVMDQEIVLVVSLVRNLELTERHIADRSIKEAVG